VCAYFTLLPDELLHRDIRQAFQYFVDHLDDENSVFWTLWLQYRPFYMLGFPIGVRSGSDRMSVEHIQFLSESFCEIFLNGTNARKLGLLAHSWTVMAADPPIAALVMQDIHLQHNFNRHLFEWCHPALTLATEAEFWMLCSLLCQCSIDNKLHESERVISFLFALFTSRFKRGEIGTAKCFVPAVVAFAAGYDGTAFGGYGIRHRQPQSAAMTRLSLENSGSFHQFLPRQSF
jgi:hypothetical protein